MSKPKLKRSYASHGLTIIELLVVVGMLIVLGAILIPTVRMLNSDQQIRESARMVNMFVSSVRDQAVVDGEAAFMLIRNRNETDRCYELRRMRILPPYSGNTVASQVAVQTVNTGTYIYFFVDLEIPFGNSSYTKINIGDSIRFNHSKNSYLIADENDSAGILTGSPGIPAGRNRYTLNYRVVVATGGTENFNAVPVANPVPPTSVALPYQVHRRPVLMRSGGQSLPGSQFIDLSRSGPLGDWLGIGVATFFDDDGDSYAPGLVNFEAGQGSIVVVFDQSGAVDRFYTRFGTDFEQVHLSNESIWLLVATDRNEQDVTTPYENLDNQTNMWVSISRTNGTAYTGQIAATDPVNLPSYTIFDRISDSKAVARRKLADSK